MKKKPDLLLYIGTYAREDEESIFLYRLEADSGKLLAVKGFKAGKKPSYMTFDPLRDFLYVVNEQETFEGKESGAVCAFSVDKENGYLKLLNKVATLGGIPVHILMGSAGKAVITANYKKGNVAVFPVREDGRLAEASDLIQHHGSGPVKERQQSAHAHYSTFSPDQRLVLVVDLGMDSVLRYRFNEIEGKLESLDPPIAFSAESGTGPRQLSIHPNGRYAYLVHELKPMVTALVYEKERGMFRELQTIATVPEDFDGENKCGGIKISPNGRNVYVSNRGHNSIAVYTIEASSGKLRLLENVPSGGDWPREFGLDPGGNKLIVANQRSNNLVVFDIERETGRLKATGFGAEIEKPVFVQVETGSWIKRSTVEE